VGVEKRGKGMEGNTESAEKKKKPNRIFRKKPRQDEKAPGNVGHKNIKRQTLLRPVPREKKKGQPWFWQESHPTRENL